jgi:F0F1-type ATP synthase assembly protein I
MKQPEQNNKKEENDSGPGWVSYLGLGTQLAVTVTAMTFLGIWLDKKFNTAPILTIICSLFGVAAGIYNFIKTVLKSN